MAKQRASTKQLDDAQRRIVLAVSIASVTLLTLASSFNLVLNDMLQDLNAMDSQTDMARQIPSIAALLVIFVAGSVGERLGARRVMLACTALYAIGSVIVTVAPVMGVATLGLLLANVGKSALFVVGLAFMSSRIASKDGRAAAFATFSAVMPVTYLIMPLIAGAILTTASWRLVALIWAVSGVVGFIAVRVLLPADRGETDSTGELLTPALAGLVLASLVQVITVLPDSGLTTRLTVTIAIGFACLVALIVAMRRMSNPTLSLEPLRHGGLVLMLIVLILTLFANLWFYMTMAMQYIYGLTAFEVAVAFIPTQIFSIAGAAWTGRLVQRKGVAFAGSLLLLIVALSLGVSALVLVTTPIWVCILIVSIYSAAAVGAGVALTNAIMDLARKGDDGSASAYRGAAMNLGTAIGVAAMTGVVFFAASSSLQEQAVSAGLDPSTATQVATEMRDGATSEEASSLYAVPLDEVDEIDSLQQNAYLMGFHAHGAVGGAITLVAAGLFYVVRRRQEAGILEVPKVEPTSAA